MHLSQYDGPAHLRVRFLVYVAQYLKWALKRGRDGMHQHIERAPQLCGLLCVGTHQSEPDSSAELMKRAQEAEAMVAALQTQCADMTAELAHAQSNSLLPRASDQVLTPKVDSCIIVGL